MSVLEPLIVQASVVSIDGRALAIEGPPGSGKSSLALALIDRGALLIGDDAVSLQVRSGQLIASPPPNIGGMIELRGIGIFETPLADPAPLCLLLTLGSDAERLPDTAKQREILGLGIPALPFAPGSIAPAIRAEWALQRHGLNPV